jgi:diaminopimelate decarboxylase
MSPITALANYPISTEINTKGHMTIGGVDALELVEKFGSPLYVMDEQTLRHQCQMYVEALKKYPIQSEVIFASKSLSVLGVLQVIHQEGLGIDVVSGGELFTALKAGFSSSQIYFHGNNKTAAELSYALDSDIGYFIVDNISELELLDRLAKKKNVTAKILLRVTPGVEAHTHEYIQTGQLDSKFGIHADAVLNVVKLALTKKNIALEGLHVHIGSQILETKPYSLAAEIMMDLIAALQKKTGVEIKILNLGGGVGINYTQKDMAPEVAAFVDLLYKTLEYKARDHKIKIPKIILEPGRSIVATAGVTLYTVGVIKEIPHIRKYVAVDGGMADNPRPITYQAVYDAVVANKISEKKKEMVTIAGKYCESGDILIKDIVLQPIETGDVLAVLGTGAYNYSMSSHYNQSPRPAMVLVNAGVATEIIRRESFEDLILSPYSA